MGEDTRAPARDEESLGSKKSSVSKSLTVLLITVVVIASGIGLSVLGKGAVDPILGGDISIVTAVCILAFLINIVAFFPAYALSTEKFYDFTGSLTYISCVAYSYFQGSSITKGEKLHLRPTIASGLVIIWSVRLGMFLFSRILKDGKDDRFDAIKVNPFRYFMVWCIQGLWVFLTAFAVFIVNGNNAERNAEDLGWSDLLGIAVWAIGFGIEVLADYQKRVWRADTRNKGKFIEYKLWYYSRHPNYFGEVMLWTGMFILCSGSLEGSQWIAMISPLFSFCLIYFVSGVRLLENKADAKWGGQEDYENYKATTSSFVILPKLGKRVHSGSSNIATSH